MTISLVEKLVSNSKYQARTWDYEDAFRYVFKINNNILEAGFFVHYKDNNPMKKVVELPTSYGCPVHCKHCASGALNSTKQLSDADIIEMFNYIAIDNNIKNNEKILVTYSGIGEGALQKNNLTIASKKITKDYRSSYFNLSTVGFDFSFIGFCENLSKEIQLNHIQVTYLHYDTETLEDIIPNARKLGFDFLNLVHAIKESRSTKVRFNYVCIKGYNDSQIHWEEFTKRIEPVRDQVIVRVSRLNETEISKVNNLVSPEIDILYALEKYLLGRGFSTHVFTPENDNTMNCGQLSWEYLTKG